MLVYKQVYTDGSLADITAHGPSDRRTYPYKGNLLALLN
jgi:hypothetical protein